MGMMDGLPLWAKLRVGMTDWTIHSLQRLRVYSDMPLLCMVSGAVGFEWLVHRIRSTGAIVLGSYTYTWYSTATHPGRVNIVLGLAFRPLLRAEGMLIAHEL